MPERLNDADRCSAQVIFVETAYQIIQIVQRTGIFKTAADCCGALHLKKSMMGNCSTIISRRCLWCWGFKGFNFAKDEIFLFWAKLNYQKSKVQPTIVL
jgi:hypothetical protein